MDESKKKTRPLQWHMPFCTSFQIELGSEAQYLTFESEHQVGIKPKEIDLLIIKEQQDITIQKNIGRIFRKYNIVEYKSPADYLSIDDFYKVIGYGCFYKIDSPTVDKRKESDITLTYICSHYPRKLIKHLEKKGTVLPNGNIIESIENGIYYIKGYLFPIQLIVVSQLSIDENMWLAALTDHLNSETHIKQLSNEYKKHRHNNLYNTTMNFIIKVNEQTFWKEKENMCQAILDLFADELREELEINTRNVTEQERNHIQKLLTHLICQNQIEDIKKLATDKEYFNTLLSQFV